MEAQAGFLLGTGGEGAVAEADVSVWVERAGVGGVGRGRTV